MGNRVKESELGWDYMPTERVVWPFVLGSCHWRTRCKIRWEQVAQKKKKV